MVTVVCTLIALAVGFILGVWGAPLIRSDVQKGLALIKAKENAAGQYLTNKK